MQQLVMKPDMAGLNHSPFFSATVHAANRTRSDIWLVGGQAATLIMAVIRVFSRACSRTEHQCERFKNSCERTVESSIMPSSRVFFDA
jgi:hypothetical protein